MVAANAGAASYVWNMGTESDYYVDGGTWSSGQVNVPASSQSNGDAAAVFARVNTQAPGLKLSSVIGGGYTINSFAAGQGTPENVYGSLYLSPTGGSGSDVLILISPMGISGTGTLTYTFDLNTHADYRTKVGTDWTAYDSAKSGTLGQVIGMIDGTSASSEFISFFGPQIGESSTWGTTFNVTQIQLGTAPVPEPVTMFSAFMGLSSLGMYIRKRMRKTVTA
jgi:hypothetical protein